MRKKLGECLVQAGLITESDLQTALAEHRRSGERLGVVLVRLKLATERQIAKVLAYKLGFPYGDLGQHPPDPEAARLIPRDVALARTCVAIAIEKNLLTVAMHDPLLFTVVQDLEFQTGYRIKQVVATRGDIVDAIHRAYPDRALARVPQRSTTIVVPKHAAPQQPADAPSRAGGILAPAAATAPPVVTAPIIDLVNLVIRNGLTSRASDIHVEPTEHNVVVRHRLDGLLKEVMDLPKWVHEGLVARIKTMAGMDVTEMGLLQGGRVRASAADGQEVNFRASTLRTIYGEKIVLRVLDQGKGMLAGSSASPPLRSSR